MRITPACWGSRASASTAPTTSARRGTGRSARAAPRCSRSSRTRRGRRCRRTSAWSRPRAWRLRCSRATRPPRRWSRSPSRASSRSSRPGEARAEEHPLRAPAALARARVRAERGAAGVRDLRRALQGLVRRPLGVDAHRAHPAAAGGGRGGGGGPAGGRGGRPTPPPPPLLAAGVAGALPGGERVAQTALPATGALYALNGLVGTVLHARGVARKPGGFAEPTYNLVMGPPLLAPGSLVLVGGMAVMAAVMRRER